jgi:extradiol dioxygenase family protein
VTQDQRPFHLAFIVRNKDEARRFYCEILGCDLGREDDRWIDFSLFGNQISAHVRDVPPRSIKGDVDGDAVPVPHFGAVLTMPQWQALAARLEAAGEEIDWVLRPKIRYSGSVGEQATMFILDPSGNAIEFKGFAIDDGLYATQESQGGGR